MMDWYEFVDDMKGDLLDELDTLSEMEEQLRISANAYAEEPTITGKQTQVLALSHIHLHQACKELTKAIKELKKVPQASFGGMK